MKMKALFVLFTLCAYSSVQAQNHAHKEEEHDHQHDKKEEYPHEHKNEISIAVGPSWLIGENEITTGIHLHYIRGLGKKKRWGVGAGFETIIGDHQHYTFTANLLFRIWKGLAIGYAAGVTILDEPQGLEVLFAQHVELGYEFEIGMFHLGPVVELGADWDELHLAGGLHTGINF